MNIKEQEKYLKKLVFLYNKINYSSDFNKNRIQLYIKHESIFRDLLNLFEYVKIYEIEFYIYYFFRMFFGNYLPVKSDDGKESDIEKIYFSILAITKSVD